MELCFGPAGTHVGRSHSLRSVVASSSGISESTWPQTSRIFSFNSLGKTPQLIVVHHTRAKVRKRHQQQARWQRGSKRPAIFSEEQLHFGMVLHYGEYE